MSGKLIEERPIMFLPTLAKALGSCERAIVLQQIHWLSKQPNSGRLFDGERWVYGTYEEWCKDYFTMWSPHTLAKHIRNLEKDGVLISAQLNAHEHDHTKFYRVNYDHGALQSMLPDVVASEVAILPDEVVSIAPNAVASKLPEAVASIAPHAVASIYRTETPSETPSEKEDNTTTRALVDFALELADGVNGWNGASAFVQKTAGGGGDLLCLISWLWLYEGINQSDPGEQWHFSSCYKSKPFTGIDNVVGYIIRQVERRIMPSLYPMHKKQLEEELASIRAPAAEPAQEDRP